jgi:CRISPR/Cas system-associated exonuclease Cas4 (RecB family)
MSDDKYSAVWVSHSSIGDFLKCPRAYYLNNVYKDPKTGHKISLMAAPLALGQAVHEVVESLSILPTGKRFDESLIKKFDVAWAKVSGKKGGFSDPDHEHYYKERGIAMLQRVMKNPGPLKNLAVKIKMDLPHYWLSEEDKIILCGKIDWLEYFPETDSVHIIDFKTSKSDESSESLQLPIYYLLSLHCQHRNVAKASYWYLERNDEPNEVALPDRDSAKERVLKIAKEMKLARKLERFNCPNGDGCMHCKPLEAIIKGQAEYVGVNDFNQDLYILPYKKDAPESEIL